MSAFGRCVNAVLDAYLRLKGVNNGLKEIENRTNPLPQFHNNSIGLQKISEEANEMRVYLLSLQPHDG